MLNTIRNFKIFGCVAGDILSINFQKRGLPRIHMLVILHHNDKPQNYANPELYETISSANSYGHCGPVIPNRPYMKNGHCSQNFPKVFCEQTNVRDDFLNLKKE